MASVVECNDVQKALACRLPAEMSDTTSIRSTTPSQDETVDSPLDGLVDDVWRDLCLMPTPPMSSPEYTQMSRPPSPVADSPTCTENEYSEALIALEMLEKMRALEDASLLPDPQSICEHSELLIQDCMWSGPYGGGIGCKELVGETSTPATTSGHVSEEQPSCSDSDVESSQQECVEPSAVFPALGADQRHLLHHHQIAPRPAGRSSRGGAMAISESGEALWGVLQVCPVQNHILEREASHGVHLVTYLLDG